MSESAIWFSAKKMREEYGAGAALQAIKRAELILIYGDIEGFNVWSNISNAITDLDRIGADHGEWIH